MEIQNPNTETGSASDERDFKEWAAKQGSFCRCKMSLREKLALLVLIVVLVTLVLGMMLRAAELTRERDAAVKGLAEMEQLNRFHAEQYFAVAGELARERFGPSALPFQITGERVKKGGTP